MTQFAVDKLLFRQQRHNSMASFCKIFLRLGFFAALVCVLPAEEIHVAFCLDNNYAEATGVAAYSLCKNKAPEDEVVIHIVMTEVLKPEHRKKFQQLEQLFPQVQIQIHDNEVIRQIVTDNLAAPDSQIKIKIYDRSSHSVGIRLVLDKVLPATLRKVIYLAGNVLILGSLKDLWNKLPKENYALAGIPSRCIDLHRSDRKTPQEKQHLSHLQKMLGNLSTPIHTYISSSILFLDLDVIRHENIFGQIIHWVKTYRISDELDQNGINFVCRDRILRCEGKWNWRQDCRNWRCPNGERPIILHYTDHPWRIPETLNDANSPVSIATADSPDTDFPNIRTTLPRLRASLEEESRIIFHEKLLALAKRAPVPEEVQNILQQIPEIDNMLQRLGWVHGDQGTLQYDLDIAVVGLEHPSGSEDYPVMVPLKIATKHQDVAIRAFNAHLNPPLDSAPSRPGEISLRSLPYPWLLCRRDSFYQAATEKNIWALMTFEGECKKLTITFYLHQPLPAELVIQSRAAHPESGERDWADLRSVFTPPDSPDSGPASAIFDLLSSREELGLTQNSGNEDTVDLQFSSIWHWYREMSPWGHY